jgi:transcriptional regulator with XRE-family HTH domain
MDPIRIVTRVKNNRLLQCREEMGMTVEEFSHYVGIGIHTYYLTASLRRYPSIDIATRIAEKTGYSVDYLFPGYLKQISKTVAVRTISEPQVIALCEARRHELITDGEISKVEEAIQTSEVAEVLSDYLRSIPPRLETIIRMRFGLDEDSPASEDVIGRYLGISGGRVHQLIDKALAVLKKDFRRGWLADKLGIKFEVSTDDCKEDQPLNPTEEREGL